MGICLSQSGKSLSKYASDKKFEQKTNAPQQNKSQYQFIEFKLCHKRKYCRICNQINVDHLSSLCPYGTRVYHGTKKKYSQNIMNGQFKICKKGIMGDGVYFCLNFKQAQNIAKHNRRNRPDAVDPVVIECLVKLDDPDVKISKYMSWAGNPQFTEVCVPNPRRVKILEIHKV